MDIVRLSETYIDCSIPSNNLQIPGCSSVRIDHPSNARRGGVLIYCKSFPLINKTNVKYLSESMILELLIWKKVC